MKPYKPAFPVEVSITFTYPVKGDEVEEFMNNYTPGLRVSGRTFKKMAQKADDIMFITWEGDLE